MLHTVEKTVEKYEKGFSPALWGKTVYMIVDDAGNLRTFSLFQNLADAEARKAELEEADRKAEARPVREYTWREGHSGKQSKVYDNRHRNWRRRQG